MGNSKRTPFFCLGAMKEAIEVAEETPVNQDIRIANGSLTS
jgi:hypothetical protein